MAAPARVPQPLTVALLGRADSARDSLRRALEDLGARVVFEGDPAGLEPGQVLQSGPQVVLVNLASGVEDDIDHLQPLFDDPHVNVVFNEAEVSSQLEGWDLARWARHLAAKLLGHERTIPPPPPGSEPLPLRNLMPVPGAPPTPAQMAIERPIEEFMIEAEDRADAVPSDHLPYASGKRTPVEEEPATDFTIDVLEVEGALAQIGGSTTVEQRAVPDPEVPEIVVHEDEAAEFDAALDLVALDAALELDTAPAPAKSGKSDAALLDEALAGLNLDLQIDDDDDDDDDSVRVAVASNDTTAGDDLEFDLDSIEVGLQADDADDHAGGTSYSIDPVSMGDDGLMLDDAQASDGGLLDADVAALAAQLDALDASAARSQVRDLEFIDFSDAPDQAPERPADSPGRTSPAASAPPSAGRAPAKASFGELDLTPMDDHAAHSPAAAKAESTYDFSGLSYSLEPTTEELEALAANQPPVAANPASAIDSLFAAMDLAPAKSAAPKAAPGPIRRVIVLGASIGGPDALRTFLGGIPEGFPALFLLAQHLETGFFERLAQQLQKASKLPVRVPEPGRLAQSGEVLVVSASRRMQVQRNGEIMFSDHTGTPKYTPCIDEVLRDVADHFGAESTAIIFSGMAGDAIEGSVYLTSLGGEVWAQDPASCVVSSMVDGARARGVVEFVGSPRELADRCVAMYGNG